jgi:hypothetical protein
MPTNAWNRRYNLVCTMQLFGCQGLGPQTTIQVEGLHVAFLCSITSRRFVIQATSVDIIESHDAKGYIHVQLSDDDGPDQGGYTLT